ncbi:MAG: electron transfer flavoprotein subunit beta/FixA family protein [Syntrophobacterales bacterium]|nr:electron transfer flavoprotein subunit beta/FixA family protein [Syntrophobacterales bacterium]
MPNVIACCKWVVDEAYIRKGAGGALDFSAVDYKLSEYDRNALEEAVRCRGEAGGKVTALTAGAPEAAKGVKDALSRGADTAVFVGDPAFADLDSSQTAAVLGEVIRSRIPYDLIICGEGSGDRYAQQVGPRLAEHLGIPCVSYVLKLSLTGEGAGITAERRVEEGVEVVEVPFPVLVTVLPEINTPRIPGVKDTLMAGKKPVVTVKKDELPPLGEVKLKTLDMTAARMERNCELFGTTPEDIARFVAALQQKGVIG